MSGNINMIFEINIFQVVGKKLWVEDNKVNSKKDSIMRIQNGGSESSWFNFIHGQWISK